MARRNATAEVNTFVRGIITEASPLTFPDNASLDEDNFVLNTDGSRQRRLGIDYEVGASKIVTSEVPSSTGEIGNTTYSWRNAGGDPDKTVVVVQIGKRLDFFDVDVTPLSDGLLHTEEFPGADAQQDNSYAIVDGTLVVVNGEKQVKVFDFDGTSVTLEKATLKIRDMFGVADTIGGTDLTQGAGIYKRPLTITENHTYNLRNQTWGPPREADGASRDRVDTILWYEALAEEYPANSDSVVSALYANSLDETNRTGDQFHRQDLQNNPLGTTPAPKGFFIIDALSRGASRVGEINNLNSQYGSLGLPVSDLPSDTTPGGASCVEEYSGRVWYGGFSGEVIDGDEKSPRMSSYVLYSQLVEEPSDIAQCYQAGDPTSKDAPDLVDTDGGFIRVDGAYNIKELINVGQGLIVLAENGVWMISGGSDYGFSANNNMVRKISDRGAVSAGSAVVVDNGVVFWATDAIYQLSPDQFGQYTAQNITQQSIQSLYDEILPLDKLRCRGEYDSYDNKIRWVYDNRLSGGDKSRELILDVGLGAFYTSSIGQVLGSLPKIVSPLEIPPFRLITTNEDVVYNGETVQYNGADVTQDISSRGQATREIAYLTVTNIAPVEYTFSTYRNPEFKDWESEDGVGVDAPAFLVTGYVSAGDFFRYKQVPYVQFHFERTEDGFENNEAGDLVPSNPSSCKVQAQWEWANSAASNRWGREFQAYRYRRHYLAEDASDPYDSGFAVITTKNKLRGKGKVLSLKITTEPEKDLRLLGWSMMIGANQNV